MEARVCNCADMLLQLKTFSKLKDEGKNDRRITIRAHGRPCLPGAQVLTFYILVVNPTPPPPTLSSIPPAGSHHGQRRSKRNKGQILSASLCSKKNVVNIKWNQLKKKAHISQTAAVTKIHHWRNSWLQQQHQHVLLKHFCSGGAPASHVWLEICWNSWGRGNAGRERRGRMAAQPLFFNRPVKNRVEKGRKGGTQHLENIRGYAMALVEGLGESG